jgi:hypothetical protein
MLPLVALLLQSCRGVTLDAGAEVPASPPEISLTPLASYRLEEIAGAHVLWHPLFDTEADLQTTLREALAHDIRLWATTAPPTLAARTSAIRIAVAPTTPATPDIPSKGRGLGFHRSAEWLTAQGFDAAREGVIEIYNAADYLEKRSREPSVLGRMIQGALDLNQELVAPSTDKTDPTGEGPRPLSEYRAEPLGGLLVMWHPDVKAGSDIETRVRKALVDDLANIARVVPAQAMTTLAGSKIVVNLISFDASKTRKHGIGAHHSADWLVENGYDAERVGAVEVYDAEDYLACRPTQPMVVLHELTHVLERKAPASTRSELDAAFAAAVASHRYEAVQHVLAPAGQLRRAYAIKNAFEYGAELAEALFGRNDQYPFVQEELLSFDPVGCAAAARLWFSECPDP